MSEFQNVCSIDDLVADSGVAVLVDGVQVALFFLDSKVYAINNFDPVGRANVISRGMVGDLNGELMVASPLYKQHYSLETGKCLDVEDLAIPTYKVKIEYNQVMIKL